MSLEYCIYERSEFLNLIMSAMPKYIYVGEEHEKLEITQSGIFGGVLWCFGKRSSSLWAAMQDPKTKEFMDVYNIIGLKWGMNTTFGMTQEILEWATFRPYDESGKTHLERALENGLQRGLVTVQETKLQCTLDKKRAMIISVVQALLKTTA